MKKKLGVIGLSILISTTLFLGMRYFKYKDGLPILGYHNVVKDEVKEKYYKNNIYVMSESSFDEQMKYLSTNHFETLTMDDVNQYYNGTLSINDKSVVLTFDDGFTSFNEIVKPILEKYNLHATCFVIGHKTEIKNSDKEGSYQYLKSEDLISDKYVEYYSHTYNLHHKADLFKKQMEVESLEYIRDDFSKNENIVNDDYFAFPYGRTSVNAQTVLKERNVKLAFGYAQNRNMIRSDDQYLLPRYLMYDFLPLFLFEWIVE